MVFVVFLIGTIGYFLGAISVKGVSLGTAGVLLAALLYGIFTSYVPSFSVGGKEIVLFDAAVKSKFSLISSIGTAMFGEMIRMARERGVMQLELEVIEGNDKARALYEKLGFEEFGHFPDNLKYADGTYADSFWMMRKL